MLLISGTGHDHSFWSGQLPLLSQHYRCIVFDNRGVGQSSTPEPGYSLYDMADDAAAVLAAEKIGNARLARGPCRGPYRRGCDGTHATFISQTKENPKTRSPQTPRVQNPPHETKTRW